MILVLMLWIAILFGVMRLLTWIARRHPGARNPAALVVAIGSGFAALVAVGSAAVLTRAGTAAVGVLFTSLFFTAITAAALFMAWNAATSPYPILVGFVVAALAVAVGLPRTVAPLAISIIILAIGSAAAWLKHRSRRHAESGVIHESAQA